MHNSDLLRRCRSVILLFLLLASPQLCAQDFEKGVEAYLAGHYLQAFEIWKPIADKGDPTSQFNIGVLYARGLGLTKDLAKAFEYYASSAEAGYAPAQFNLGSLYASGQGVEKNPALAAQWWQLAAKQNHEQAQYNLATLYMMGLGVSQDTAKAKHWYQQAANRGDERAKEKLRQIIESEDTSVVDSNKLQSAAEKKENTRDGKPDAAANSKPTDELTKKPRSSTAVTKTKKPVPSIDLLPFAWIYRQPPAHFTVQLMADSRRVNVERFIDKHGLENDAGWIKSIKHDPPLFKVLYGSFAEVSAARTAARKLPLALQKHQPWIRRFSALYAELDPELLQQLRQEADEQKPAITTEGAEKEEMEADDKTPVKKQTVVDTTKVEGQRTENKPAAMVSREKTVTGKLKNSKPPEEPVIRPLATNSQEEPALLSYSAAQPGGQRDKKYSSSVETIAKLRAAQLAFNQQRYTEALDLWRPLANDGESEAQYGMAFLYESGWGVEKDYEVAVRHYRQAAERGHVKAQFNLGMLYLLGQGLERNESLGLYWIQSAADRSDDRAREFLQRSQFKSSLN